MGVTGLWQLLEPVGRRVDVAQLAGKRLAVDASIWLFQFMRAMRDERGEMLPNAHLHGFFRRICRRVRLLVAPAAAPPPPRTRSCSSPAARRPPRSSNVDLPAANPPPPAHTG